MPEWKVPGYTELKVLGSGGFGDVVLARHDASGTLVAIKYLHGDLLADSEFAGMFRGEATVLASLDDPNVVRLYEYVESPSGAAIVMELIGGVSLREILTYQGRTTAEAALVVLQGSLLGLAAAHRRGVVHRDYKPENVLVNGDGVSKLTDFGIAARAGDRPVPAGTLLYAAPEQMAGASASPAGDVYAATATFYECLTGRPPFSGRTAADLVRQHQSEPVPLDPVPEALRPLVAAGMAKDPSRRPTDATSFVTELGTVASGAYGRHWHDRGRSHLGEAALLLAALWPSGAPPTVQGTTVHRIRLFRKARHLSPVKAAIAAGVAIAAVAAGTALAATGSPGPAVPNHPAAAVRSISLQPSPTLISSPTTPSSPPPKGGGSSTPTSSGGGGGSSTVTSSGGSGGSSTSSSSGGGGGSSGSGGGGGSSTFTSSGGGGGGSSTSSSSGGGGGSSTSSSSGTGGGSPPVPEITSVSTYQQGALVYFDVQYTDPGHDAEGFGFVGVNGSGWAEENHPFSSPSYGIVGTDSIAYPFNEACGTAQQYDSYVEAWIYDTAGDRSTPVVIHLVCTG
jgi:serine/threonine protein kinase